jgi:hypothetical protein
MTRVSDARRHSLVTSPVDAVQEPPVGPPAGLHGPDRVRAPLTCVTPGRDSTVVGARLQALQPSPGTHGAATHFELQGLGIEFIRVWGERMCHGPIIPQKRCETQRFRTYTLRFQHNLEIPT